MWQSHRDRNIDTLTEGQRVVSRAGTETETQKVNVLSVAQGQKHRNIYRGSACCQSRRDRNIETFTEGQRAVSRAGTET